MCSLYINCTNKVSVGFRSFCKGRSSHASAIPYIINQFFQTKWGAGHQSHPPPSFFGAAYESYGMRNNDWNSTTQVFRSPSRIGRPIRCVGESTHKRHFFLGFRSFDSSDLQLYLLWPFLDCDILHVLLHVMKSVVYCMACYKWQLIVRVINHISP